MRLMILPAALPAALVVALMGTAMPASAQSLETCVINGSDHGYLFVAEAPDGTRVVSPLEPGGKLCAAGGKLGARAVVSVFEDKPGNIEGCSWLVKGGDTETLLKFSEADRCKWSFHEG